MVKSAEKVIYATGRRKQSVARVWLHPEGSGFTVNEKKMEEYFDREDLRMIVRQPLDLLNTGENILLAATVKGGGVAGQAGALRHGISRVLALYDETFRSPLRKGGYLTRDPREKERKKFGKKGARRSFQFTKR